MIGENFNLVGENWFHLPNWKVKWKPFAPACSYRLDAVFADNGQVFFWKTSNLNFLKNQIFIMIYLTCSIMLMWLSGYSISFGSNKVILQTLLVSLKVLVCKNLTFYVYSKTYCYWPLSIFFPSFMLHIRKVAKKFPHFYTWNFAHFLLIFLCKLASLSGGLI